VPLKVLAAAVLLAASLFASAGGPVILASVTVHLFYERSGALSPDITTIKEFGSWNFSPFGEGVPGDESFHAFLIKLEFSAPKATFEPGLVATVQVTNDNKQVIFKREIRGLYVPESGRTYRAVWVDGHECEALNVEVKSAAQMVTKRLRFACGE
jgi:hypothetical protein